MSRRGRMAPVMFAVTLAVTASALAATDRHLHARIVPHFSPAPGSVRVIASIEPDHRNHRLRVEAESPSFFRRTEIPLNGRRAARVHTITFTDLPAGNYEIRVRLGRTTDELITVKEFVVTSETAD